MGFAALEALKAWAPSGYRRPRSTEKSQQWLARHGDITLSESRAAQLGLRPGEYTSTEQAKKQAEEDYKKKSALEWEAAAPEREYREKEWLRQFDVTQKAAQEREEREREAEGLKLKAKSAATEGYLTARPQQMPEDLAGGVRSGVITIEAAEAEARRREMQRQSELAETARMEGQEVAAQREKESAAQQAQIAPIMRDVEEGRKLYQEQMRGAEESGELRVKMLEAARALMPKASEAERLAASRKAVASGLTPKQFAEEIKAGEKPPAATSADTQRTARAYRETTDIAKREAMKAALQRRAADDPRAAAALDAIEQEEEERYTTESAMYERARAANPDATEGELAEMVGSATRSRMSLSEFQRWLEKR